MQTSAPAVFGQQARLLKQAHQHWEHGLALSKKGEWRSAVKFFDKACKANPSDTLFRLNLARAYLRSGMAAEALHHTELILEQEHRNMLAKQFLGECLSYMGRHSDAASAMLDMPPDLQPSAEYMQILGNTLFSAQRFDEAVKILFEALSLDVTHAMSHYRLGLCFNALGMKQEAIECLTTALALDIGGGKLACRSIMAFIKREPGHAVSDAELLAQCRGRIASFKIPRHVIFVDDFPMTSSGKIQKVKLRDEALRRIPPA